MATSQDYMTSREESFIKYQLAKKAEDSADTTTGEDEEPDTDSTDTEETLEGSTEGTTEEESKPAEDEDTETVPETEEETAPDEGEEKVPSEVELSSDDLKALWETYGDKIRDLDTVKESLGKEADTKAQRQAADQQRITEQRLEVDRLVQDGTQAVNGIFSALESASQELGKANRDEEFNAAVLNPQEFQQNFDTYTRAVVAELRGRYTTAIDRTVLSALNDLPTLTDGQISELQSIVDTAYRMEGDPRQAPEAAYFATNKLVNFLLERTREAAFTEERTRGQSREAVTKKVAEQNAIKAAAAKLAAERKKVPPKAPADAKTSTDGDISEEAYDRAVAAGDHGQAQRIVDQMSRRAIGR